MATTSVEARERLGAILGRLKATTPGPWHAERKYSNGCETTPEIWTERAAGQARQWIATVIGAPHLGHAQTVPNAELMAHAPADLAFLAQLAGEFLDLMEGPEGDWVRAGMELMKRRAAEALREDLTLGYASSPLHAPARAARLVEALPASPVAGGGEA